MFYSNTYIGFVVTIPQPPFITIGVITGGVIDPPHPPRIL
jgi:hypothetical protein